MAPLTNHRILITGASRGLGAALSVAFAKEGCDVAINYLSSKDAAEEVARKVRAEGRKAVVIQGDAGVKKDCTRMVEETVTGLGGVEGVVANAVCSFSFCGRRRRDGDRNGEGDTEMKKGGGGGQGNGEGKGAGDGKRGLMAKKCG